MKRRSQKRSNDRTSVEFRLPIIYNLNTSWAHVVFRKWLQNLRTCDDTARYFGTKGCAAHIAKEYAIKRQIKLRIYKKYIKLANASLEYKRSE